VKVFDTSPRDRIVPRLFDRLKKIVGIWCKINQLFLALVQNVPAAVVQPAVLLPVPGGEAEVLERGSAHLLRLCLSVRLGPRRAACQLRGSKGRQPLRPCHSSRNN
jgi:hypothetical protein